MSTASAYLTVAGLGVDVVYKDIKNLHISVYPPIGRVRVAAPERTDEDTIRLAIVQRLPWIKRQREQLQRADRQTERQMLSGETHYVWGQRYRLDVSAHQRPPRVEPKGKTLWVIDPRGRRPPTSRSPSWIAGTDDELKAAVPALLEKWQPILGVRASRSSSAG